MGIRAPHPTQRELPLSTWTWFNKEPSANQMAARERQKTCAAGWKTAKEAGKVEAGMKWPKFWSQCNTRLKGEKT